MRIPFLTAAVLTLALVSFATSSVYSEEKEGSERTSPSKEQITYLGVASSHLTPSLREHLEIAEGFAIQVHEVMPGSPAAKAGLKKNDILLRFNDQLLISPEHLSLLVKQEKPENEVLLGLIRRGERKELTVKLGAVDRLSQKVRPRPDPSRMTLEQWQEHLKTQQDYWKRWMDRGQQDQNSPAPRKSADSEEAPEISGRPPAVSMNPGFPVRIFGTEGVIKIDNDEGEVSIFHENDGHRIVIDDAEGREIYSGDYDAELGIEGLPEEAQEHLRLMKLENLEILAPQASPEAPERTSSPMPPAPTGEDAVL